MSRIGRQPVAIPNGVTVEINGQHLIVKGPKGELQREIHKDIKVEIKDNQVLLTKLTDTKEAKALHGLFRSLVANMVEGVSKGFERKLEIVGIGYRAITSGNKITLNIGYSHPIEYKAPQGIVFSQNEENKGLIIITGIDKQIVGEVAAKVRSYRKPEPYKGKGIKYLEEHIVRKSGKAAASTSGAA